MWGTGRGTMENISVIAIRKILTEAQNNPEQIISLSEFCDILREERVLIQDQADMHDIGFDAVDLP